MGRILYIKGPVTVIKRGYFTLEVERRKFACFSDAYPFIISVGSWNNPVRQISRHSKMDDIMVPNLVVFDEFGAVIERHVVFEEVMTIFRENRERFITRYDKLTRQSGHVFRKTPVPHVGRWRDRWNCERSGRLGSGIRSIFDAAEYGEHAHMMFRAARRSKRWARIAADDNDCDFPIRYVERNWKSFRRTQWKDR